MLPDYSSLKNSRTYDNQKVVMPKLTVNENNSSKNQLRDRIVPADNVLEIMEELVREESESE